MNPSEIVGRESARQELERWRASSARLLHVTGPAGVGKSALLTSWSRRHGALHLDLTNCENADDLLAITSHALDAHEEEKIEEVLARTASDQPTTLLILDHVDGALTSISALLSHWLETIPPLRIIVSARGMPEPPLACPRLVLDGLDASASLALLARYGVDTSGARAPLARRVAKLLEGNPLALLWVARHREVYPLERWAKRLEGKVTGFSTTAIWGTRGALHEAFMMSWDALSLDAARVCAALTHLRAAHPLDTLLAWLSEGANIEEDVWVMGLQEAHDASLVRSFEHRFALSALTRRAILAHTAAFHPEVADYHMASARRLENALIAECSKQLEQDRSTPIIPSREFFEEIWGVWRSVDKLEEHDQGIVRRWIARALEGRGSYSTWFERDRSTETRAEALSRTLEATDDLETRCQLYGVLARQLRSTGAFLEAAEAFGQQASIAMTLEDWPRAWRNTWRKVQMLVRAKAPAESITTICEELLEAYHSSPSLHRDLPKSIVLLEAIEHEQDKERARGWLEQVDALEQHLPPQLEARRALFAGDLANDRSDAISHYRQAIALEADEITPRARRACSRSLTWLGRWEEALATRGDEDILVDVLISMNRGRWEEAKDLLATPGRLRGPLHDVLATISGVANGVPDVGKPIARGGAKTPMMCALSTLATSWEEPQITLALPPWEESVRHPESDFIWAAHMLSRAHSRYHNNLSRLPSDIAYAKDRGVMLVLGDLDALVTPNGTWIELLDRPLYQALLELLLAQHERAPKTSVTLADIFAAVWPDEPHTQARSAANRVRVLVSRAREDGLRDHIMTRKGGYMLDPSLTIESKRSLICHPYPKTS